jgi:monoamine oxidase
MKYDYVIIGSGMAGLNTAYQISKKTLNKPKILIIEKEEDIGGRIQTIYLHDNLHYESGGIRFYPSHKNLLTLLKEMGYSKKDYLTIPNEYKKNYILIKSRKLNVSEKDLNKILLLKKNIKKYSDDELLNMTFEDYTLNLLGEEKYKYLTIINGFPHVFKNTSAKYGLQLLNRDFNSINEFYIIKNGGLTDLLHKMLDFISNNSNVSIQFQEKYLDFKKVKNELEIETNKNSYLTKNLILAIPLNKLKSKIPRNLTTTVNPISLNRMFAIYPDDNYWYEDLDSTYTDENIQRIFLKGSRLVQIAYSSSERADFWNELSKDQIKLKKELQKELRRMFPEKKIKHPEMLNMHYWDAGIHLWKVGIEGEEISKKILKPIDKLNVYVCNEAYSFNQRWMEGSLEMSNRVVDLLL